jgi:hypothetical protein
MSGRRSYARFNINPSSEGVLRVLRDITVQRAHKDEVVVVGREPGVVGDVMSIEVTGASPQLDGQVQVLESVPVVVDGCIRHQLRLRRLSVGGPSGEAQNGWHQFAPAAEEIR